MFETHLSRIFDRTACIDMELQLEIIFVFPVLHNGGHFVSFLSGNVSVSRLIQCITIFGSRPTVAAEEILGFDAEEIKAKEIKVEMT